RCFFRAEDGIRDFHVTGVQTCALPILVIAEKPTAIETLTVGEAVMKMDLQDLPALMFFNSGHGRLNVVYRRVDGNISWVDPEAEIGRASCSEQLQYR